jgi:RND family efflux transporter MFP subunit
MLMLLVMAFPAWAEKPVVDTPVVAVVTAERRTLSRPLTFTADLKPWQEAAIYAKIAGYIKTLPVDVGDRVKAGDILATLDIPELASETLKNQSIYQNAADDYRRLKTIAKQQKGLLAQEEIDKAREAFDVAKANWERARTMQEYATMRAPFAGIITKRYLSAGALIQAGVSSSSQAVPLVYLVDDSALRLRFPVPESVAGSVKPKGQITVTVGAAQMKTTATITRIAGNIDAATRTMEVEATLENPAHTMIAGMYATASLQLDEKAQVITLPVQTLQKQDKPTVWVVRPDNTLEQRPISIGLTTPDYVEIVTGLNEGERVVYGNPTGLEAGKKVTAKPLSRSGEEK